MSQMDTPTAFQSQLMNSMNLMYSRTHQKLIMTAPPSFTVSRAEVRDVNGNESICMSAAI